MSNLEENINETPEPILPIFNKPTKGDRILRSDTARQKRKDVKIVKSVQSIKEESDAKQRLRAKRTLERQKRRVRNREMRAANI